MLSKFRLYSTVAILVAPTNIATSIVRSSFVDIPASRFEAAPTSRTSTIDLLLEQPRRTRLAASYSGSHSFYELLIQIFWQAGPLHKTSYSHSFLSA